MKILLLIFTFCLISDGGASKEVTGYSGGDVLFRCKYDTDYTQNPKYFCKGSSPGCSDLIKTGDKNMWVTSERFSLFDDTKSAEFWVMIKQLTVEDTGTYQCGVDKSLGKDIYTPVELKVKEDGGASKEVTVYSGGGVLIKCKYNTKYKRNLKYFCKDSWPDCSDLIKTEDKNMWVTSGRFSLFDDTKSAEFRVMIRELTVEDTGTYQCGVDKSSGNDIYTPVELTVKEDLSYEKSISKTVHEGEDLKISCKYPQSLRNHTKFLCKGLQPAACVYSESVTESRKDVNVGKFSLYDDGTEQIFTVNIRNVIEQDSGDYWCGAEAAWTSDHGYKVYFTQITLTVTDGGDSKEVTGYSGSEILIKCKYDTAFTQNLKKFCKGSSPGCSDLIKTGDKNMWVTSGRFSLFDDTKSAEISLMIRELTVEDTGTYQCGVDKSQGMYIYLPVELKVQEEHISGVLLKYQLTVFNSECLHDDRLSVHDNRSAGFFSVFIREHITEDTETHSCGVTDSD